MYVESKRRHVFPLTAPSQTGNIALDIFTLDPGGMTGESNLRTGAPLAVRVAHQTRAGLRPFFRIVSRSSINRANVPAKAIAKVAFQGGKLGKCETERYYILDSEYEAASVLPVLRDEAWIRKLLLQMLRQAEVGSRKTKDSRLYTDTSEEL